MTAAENDRFQLSGVPPGQKINHILQLNPKAPGLFTGILAVNHTMLRQPERLAFADMENAVKLFHRNGFRVFLP